MRSHVMEGCSYYPGSMISLDRRGVWMIPSPKQILIYFFSNLNRTNLFTRKENLSLLDELVILGMGPKALLKSEDTFVQTGKLGSLTRFTSD